MSRTTTARPRLPTLTDEQMQAADAFLAARRAFVHETSDRNFEANNAAYNAMWALARKGDNEKAVIRAMLYRIGLLAREKINEMRGVKSIER